MNNLFRQQKTQTIRWSGGFFAILQWLSKLTSIIHLTGEEQEAAGIDLDSRYDNVDQE